jgi:hypothetical protein
MTRLYISEHLARVTFISVDTIPALTGISTKVFDLLQKRQLLSLEIKSADNINSLQSVEKGHYLFLTPILREDLLPKGRGIICELKAKSVMLQKVKKWDEVEIVAVRIQVRPVCVGRVKKVMKKNLGEGLTVKIEQAYKCPIS